MIPIRWWKCRRRWLWSSLWQDMHDHVGKISTRSWLVRLDLWGWCHIDGYTTNVYFQLLLNCTSGRVHVNSYLDFIRAYPQKWLTCWRKKNSGYHGTIRCRKVRIGQKIVVNWELGTPISTLVLRPSIKSLLQSATCVITKCERTA